MNESQGDDSTYIKNVHLHKHGNWQIDNALNSTRKTRRIFKIPLLFS